MEELEKEAQLNGLIIIVKSGLTYLEILRTVEANSSMKDLDEHLTLISRTTASA